MLLEDKLCPVDDDDMTEDELGDEVKEEELGGDDVKEDKLGDDDDEEDDETVELSIAVERMMNHGV